MMEFVKTEPGDDPIIVECYFAVPPAKVFQAWTDPNIVMKWFGPALNTLHSATIDLREGGAWCFIKSKDDQKSAGFEGEYLAIEPGKRLVFTWAYVTAHSNGEREATPYSQVEIIFTAKGKGTDVRLIHSAMHNEDMRKGFAGGWELGFTNMSVLLNGSEGVSHI